MVVTILIISSIIQWAVIAVLLRRAYGHRLEFTWQTTFFGKTRHGFYITVWDYQRFVTPNYGKIIFRFSWRDPKTIPDRPYIKNAAKWAFPRLILARS